MANKPLSLVVGMSLSEPNTLTPVSRCSCSMESLVLDRGPYRHAYDEIQFIHEGCGMRTDKAKTSFKAVGDSPLMQVDVHLSPRFIQENL
jgi:hypothetical protein